jgi:hypothetical protein
VAISHEFRHVGQRADSWSGLGAQDHGIAPPRYDHLAPGEPKFLGQADSLASPVFKKLGRIHSYSV